MSRTGPADSRATDAESEPLLDVQNLHTTFYTDKETIRAVQGADFTIDRSETIGLVGESGSGKSVTARSIMGLISNPGRIDEGRVKLRAVGLVRELADAFGGKTVDLTNYDLDDVMAGDPGVTTRDEAAERVADPGDFVFVEERDADGTVTDGYVDTTRAPEKGLQRIRGGGVAMIFQDPLSSLNPVYSIGNQLKETIKKHQGLTGDALTDEAIDLLEAVGISDATRRLKEYPHQFSGGMRQRAVIAIALACEPEVLIADEPTTALDVTIQAQILELLDEIQAEREVGVMFITHDMGVIAEIADHVNVMYAGEIVETAPVVELYRQPKHPYTQGLLDSIPGRQGPGERLSAIEGEVPTPTEEATFCRFAPRCPEAFEECERLHPRMVPIDDLAEDHTARCLLYPEDRARARALERHRRGDEADGEGKGKRDRDERFGTDERDGRDGRDGRRGSDVSGGRRGGRDDRTGEDEDGDGREIGGGDDQ